MMAVYMAAGLGGVMMLAGFAGSMQVSAGRVTLERLMAYRAIDGASSACFEEVAGKLEGRFTDLRFPGFNQHRDLGRDIAWPASVEPVLARADHAVEGIEVGPVLVKSSPWLMFEAFAPDGSLLVLERGFLEMRVLVSVKLGNTRIRRWVVCRRIVSAEPAPSGDRPRIKIQAANLLRVMKEGA